MPWNWELAQWPNFRYDAESIARFERQFLFGIGGSLAYLKTIEREERDRFVVEILTLEGVESSKIEGEILDRESLQSSIRKHFGLDSKRKSGAKESGMAELLCNQYESFSEPLTHEMLWSWHAMLFKDSSDVETRGAYRSHKEPMQIVSSRIDSPRVFFKAPPSAKILDEMTAFIQWFNATAETESIQVPSHKSFEEFDPSFPAQLCARARQLDASCRRAPRFAEQKNLGANSFKNFYGQVLGRAAIAHVYFESIHPFEDGNGRIGRLLVEKILSQGIGQPVLIAVSKLLEKEKKAYYAALERCNCTLQVQDWVEFFSATILQAQAESMKLLEFLIQKAKMLQALAGQLNERQQKVLLRMFAEGPSGFKGGLSAENYIVITKAPRATATRDLTDLVEKGALIKTGELRYTRYRLNI